MQRGRIRKKGAAIQLIVNADDFGASEQVNEAIIRSFKEGVLTSCSLMVAGEAFEQAIELAKQHPQLAVGIHLVVISGRSVLAPSQIPTLVDGRGRFSNKPVAAGMRYYFFPQARQDLEKELKAQFEKFQTAGLDCSHIDGHWHFHIHPIVFDLAVRIGKHYGVRQMRVPEDDLDLALRFEPRHSLQKRAHAMVFHALCRRMRHRLTAEDFVCTDRVFGFFETGRMNTAYFLWVLEHLRTETNEIYFHPACPRRDLRQPTLRDQSLAEYEALVDKRVIQRVRQLGIRLTTYRALRIQA